LNGQATPGARGCGRSARIRNTAVGLSFAQLKSLIDLLNGAFESCGPSAFAQGHIYQPYVTSSAFAPNQKRPSTVSTFADKPAYNTFSEEVVPVLRDADGRRLGCTSSSYGGFPVGKIALIERGVCTFYQKVSVASAAGACAAIIFNSEPAAGCPTAAFVQRSTGLLLRDGPASVTAFVQQ
jgi:hypothetical protein